MKFSYVWIFSIESEGRRGGSAKVKVRCQGQDALDDKWSKGWASQCQWFACNRSVPLSMMPFLVFQQNISPQSEDSLREEEEKTMDGIADRFIGFWSSINICTTAMILRELERVGEAIILCLMLSKIVNVVENIIGFQSDISYSYKCKNGLTQECFHKRFNTLFFKLGI